jgi:hypothetical protein
VTPAHEGGPLDPGFTVVVAVAESFSRFGSAVVELTVAVFESGPAAVGVTTIVTVADAPAAREPSSHVTTPPPEQLPAEADAETNVTAAGSGSLTVTASAVLGPAFVAVIV